MITINVTRYQKNMRENRFRQYRLRTVEPTKIGFKILKHFSEWVFIGLKSLMGRDPVHIDRLSHKGGGLSEYML